MSQRVLVWWSVPVLGLCLGVGGARLGYQMLPKTYEAATKVFVAPSQIPQQFVRTAVNEDIGVRLMALQEAVVSRPFLEKILAEFFHPSSDLVMFDKQIKDLRARLIAKLEDYDDRRGSGLFSLRYRDEDPTRAARVVNRLAELYKNENVRVRTEQAESTAETVGGLAEDVAGKLEAQEKAIADFKAAHAFELSDHANANMSLLQQARMGLDTVNKDIAMAQDRLQLLHAQAKRADGTVVVTGSQVIQVAKPETAASKLRKAQQELADLLVRFTDKHPVVRQKMNEVAVLEQAVRNAPPEQPGDAATEGATGGQSEVQLQIEAAQQELARLMQQRDNLQRDINTYTARMERTPLVEQQLAELSKGHDVLRARYQELQSKHEEARGSLRVEESHKGSQFEVVEPATAPTTPVSPVKLQLYALGVFAGLVLSVLPLILPGLLRPTVQFSKGLELLDGTPVLATIDVVETAASRMRHRRRNLVNVIVTTTAMAFLMVALTLSLA